MQTLTDIRLPVLIVHRGRLFKLAQTTAGGLVLKSVEGSENPTLDTERGTCVIVTADSRTPVPGGA